MIIDDITENHIQNLINEAIEKKKKAYNYKNNQTCNATSSWNQWCNAKLEKNCIS